MIYQLGKGISNMRLKIPILIIILSGLAICYSCDEKPSEQAKDIRWEKYATVIQDPNKEIILPDVFSGFTFTTDHEIGAYALFSRPSPVHLISMESGNHILTIKGHPLSTQSISFSPDGKKILTGGTDNVVRLWDITTGEQLGQSKEHSNMVRCVAYSPVGERALSGGDDRVILLWDLEKMQVIKRFTGHTSGIRHRCLVFSKDGKSFLSGNWDGTIRLWDVESVRELVCLQAGKIRQSNEYCTVTGWQICLVKLFKRGTTCNILGFGKTKRAQPLWCSRKSLVCRSAIACGVCGLFSGWQNGPFRTCFWRRAMVGFRKMGTNCPESSLYQRVGICYIFPRWEIGDFCRR